VGDPFFNPPRDAIPGILADLRRSDLCFTDLAQRHGTSPDALALWLTSPAIAAQLESTDSVVCYRTRLIAAEHMPASISACLVILQSFNARHAQGEPTAPAGVDAESLELRRIREFECARKAASTLVRLTRLPRTPGPAWDPKRIPPAHAKPSSPPGSSKALEAAALSAALQFAATVDPTRDAANVLEDLARDDSHISPPPKRAPQPAPPSKPRPIPFPSKQLWRTNIPGAAQARAP
jgi:hypothetical protein